MAVQRDDPYCPLNFRVMIKRRRRATASLPMQCKKLSSHELH